MPFFRDIYNRMARSTGQAAGGQNFEAFKGAVGRKVTRYGAAAIIGMGTYGAVRGGYEATIGQYDLSAPARAGVEGMGANETMLFKPQIETSMGRGMVPGQYGDDGNLALALHTNRRG